ncbi:MAG: response regulator [Methanobacteriota archaeon]
MTGTRSLLFVDDYDMLRKIYVDILSDAGYQVTDASSAKQCMEALSKKIPDLILLDIMMKPVDGWETLLQIRAYPPALGVPVVMISGKAILPVEVIRYGPLIDGFLRKPLQNAILIASIAEFFGWFEALKVQCASARAKGADDSVVAEYFSLKRQDKAIKRMLSIIQKEYGGGSDRIAVDSITDSINEIETFHEGITQRLEIVEPRLSGMLDLTY